MLNLLKKLFSTGTGMHTVVVLNDDGSKKPESYRLSPINLWLSLSGLLIVVIALVLLVIMYTPFGGFIYDERDLRESVIEIQQRVSMLQDTLDVRNEQLSQIQSVLSTGQDTSFAVDYDAVQAPVAESSPVGESSAPELNEGHPIPTDVARISNLFKHAPEFPAPFPISGSNTRMFNNSAGHYGFDIAAESGSSFSAVAAGVIVSQVWTLNFGYVIVVQHADNILSIYKHAARVEHQIGASVQQGDILGAIGDIGVLSSGPHLHIEIWDHGIPRNPADYLINP